MCSPKIVSCMCFTINVPLIIVYLGYLLFLVQLGCTFSIHHLWRIGKEHKQNGVKESKVKPQKDEPTYSNYTC